MDAGHKITPQLYPIHNTHSSVWSSRRIARKILSRSIFFFWGCSVFLEGFYFRHRRVFFFSAFFCGIFLCICIKRNVFPGCWRWRSWFLLHNSFGQSRAHSCILMSGGATCSSSSPGHVCADFFQSVSVPSDKSAWLCVGLAVCCNSDLFVCLFVDSLRPICRHYNVSPRYRRPGWALVALPGLSFN